MTIGPITVGDVKKLWQGIEEESELHFDDAGREGIKTLSSFEEHLKTASFVLAVMKGKKFAGAVGVWINDETADAEIHAHFVKEVRGTGLPLKAFWYILSFLFASGAIKTVTGRYFETNTRVHRFLQKLGPKFMGPDGTATVNGQPVNYLKVVFEA